MNKNELILNPVEQAEHTSDEDSSFNENHSCEDEELVISPQESGVSNKKDEQAIMRVSKGPIETFAEDDTYAQMDMDDPYQSG